MNGLSQMSRRILNALMLCIALLFAGLPAFACDPSVGSSDCCDPSGTLPCGSGQDGSLNVVATQCCSASASVVAAEAPASQELPFVGDFMELPPAYCALAHDSSSSHRISFVSPSPPYLSGTHIYLKTGRLRL